MLVVPSLSFSRLHKMRRLVINDEIILSCIGRVVDDVIFNRLFSRLKKHFGKGVNESALRVSMDILRGKILCWNEWLRYVVFFTGNVYKLCAGEVVSPYTTISNPEWLLLRIAKVSKVNEGYSFLLRVEAGTGCPCVITKTYSQSRTEYLWDTLLGLTYRTRERYLYRTVEDFIGSIFWGLTNSKEVITRFEVTPTQQKEHRRIFRDNDV